jgi:hypothetical protein
MPAGLVLKMFTTSPLNLGILIAGLFGIQKKTFVRGRWGPGSQTPGAYSTWEGMPGSGALIGMVKRLICFPKKSFLRGQSMAPFALFEGVVSSI